MVPLIDPVSSCATAGNPARRIANRAIPAIQRRPLTKPGLRMNFCTSCVITDLPEARNVAFVRGLSVDQVRIVSNRFLAIPLSRPTDEPFPLQRPLFLPSHTKLQSLADFRIAACLFRPARRASEPEPVELPITGQSLTHVSDLTNR